MATTQLPETDVPRLEPVGVQGCATCSALAESREIAREVRDLAAVRSASAEIAEHPHAAVAARRPRVWGVVS